MTKITNSKQYDLDEPRKNGFCERFQNGCLKLIVGSDILEALWKND